MILIPYEITFLPTRRSKERQRECWIWFAPSLEAALAGAKKAALEEHLQAHSWTVAPAGQEADGRVHGVLRGGRVFRKRFYFHGPDPRVVDLEDAWELQIY